MNKTKLLVLTLFVASIAQAGVTTNNNNAANAVTTGTSGAVYGQPSYQVRSGAGRVTTTSQGRKKLGKPKTRALKDQPKPMPIKQAGQMMQVTQPAKPAQTLEEQHLVIPNNNLLPLVRADVCKDVQQIVATELHKLVAESKENLQIQKPNEDPTTIKGPRLGRFIDPQTKQSINIYYTAKKPILMINNREEYIDKIYQLFQKLAQDYAHCGLTTQEAKGTAQPKVEAEKNILAWFYFKPGLMGASKFYLILEEVTPTKAQASEWKAKQGLIKQQ